MADGNSNFNHALSFNEPRPSNVLRVHPWGGQRYCTQANVRNIRSLNARVRAQLEASELPHKSVLANYQLIGSVWINAASALPAVADPPVVGRDQDCSNGHYEKFTVPESRANLAGSILLANTTMETFTQGLGCFACHNGGFPNTQPPASLKLSISHLFRDIYTNAMTDASRVPRAK
jgi:hypothetical protein